MISIFFLWSILFFDSSILGVSICLISKRYFSITKSFIETTIIGIVGLTVISEYMSLLIPIGRDYFVGITICAFMLSYACRNELKKLINFRYSKKTILCIVAIIIWIIIILFMTINIELYALDILGDTAFYHITAVKWIQQYGCVKGIANLVSRIGFNNSIFCFYAFAGAFGIFQDSLHCGLGFILCIFGTFAILKIVNFNSRNCVSTAMAFYLLIYCMNYATSSATYNTDVPANLFAGYIITKWFENIENKDVDEKYGLLSLLIAYTATIKLSMAFLLLLAIKPLVGFIKKRRYKEIIFFFCFGIIITMPFFIRNYYISGWLIYPFGGIDLFNVKWKVPIEVVQIEKNSIYCMARKPNAPLKETLSDTINQWIPVWWENQRIEYKIKLIMLIASIMGLCFFLIRENSRKQYRDELGCIMVMILNVLYWFVSAPDVRFQEYIISSIPISIIVIIYSSLWHKKTHYFVILFTAMLFYYFVHRFGYWTYEFMKKDISLLNLSQGNIIFVQKSFLEIGEKIIKKDDIEYRIPINNVVGNLDIPAVVYEDDVYNIGMLSNEIKGGFYYITR